MLVNSNSWKPFFIIEASKDYFNLLQFAFQNEYEITTCFPPKELIFSAFDYCNFNDLKVVIIGQDPYHGAGEANGLCFSVNDGVKIPPSLKNIFIEINKEYNQFFMPTTGNLQSWAEQGVLLLNSSLTVRENQPNSHQFLQWEQFTNAVISYISEYCINVVFMLWGSFAHKKSKFIDNSKHCILKAGHPSPLSANRGFWFGNNHFIMANEFLREKGKSEINWIIN